MGHWSLGVIEVPIFPQAIRTEPQQPITSMPRPRANSPLVFEVFER